MLDLIWSSGKNETIEWVQYGNLKTEQIVITLKRDILNKAVDILLHDVSDAAKGLTPPEYAGFSLETGAGEKTIGMDGVGFLILMSDRSTGFQIPQATGRNLELLRSVFQSTNDSFRVWINEKCYTFPVENYKKELEEICR